MWPLAVWLGTVGLETLPVAQSMVDINDGGGDERKIISALSLFVVVGLALILVFLLVTFVLVRSARRARASSARRGRQATASEDVWSMHRAPEIDDEDDGASNDEDDDEQW